MSEFIRKRVEELGLTTNQLSYMSGMGASQLSRLVKGETRPGRDKLIQIGVSLSLELEQMNALLNRYGYESEISESDNSYFIETSKRREIRGNQVIYRDSELNINLAILSIERISGPGRWVTYYPYAIFRSPKSSWMFREKDDIVYKSLFESVWHERRRVFERNLKQNVLKHLVCEKCMEDRIVNLQTNYNIESNELICREYGQLIKYINVRNYDFKLIAECPFFQFYIKDKVDTNTKLKPISDVSRLPSRGRKPRQGQGLVLFTGKSAHYREYSSNRKQTTGHQGPIYGVMTDNDSTYSHFDSEFKRLEEFPLKISHDKGKLTDHIMDMLKTHNVDTTEVEKFASL